MEVPAAFGPDDFQPVADDCREVPGSWRRLVGSSDWKRNDLESGFETRRGSAGPLPPLAKGPTEAELASGFKRRLAPQWFPQEKRRWTGWVPERLRARKAAGWDRKPADLISERAQFLGSILYSRSDPD